MPRRVLGGLIQAASPLTDPATPIDVIRKASIDVHMPLIEEAGKKGVQILCLQEIFNGPYFCPTQDKRWYDAAEPVPGPTTELMPEYAKKYQMAMVVPVYEREHGGRLLQHRGGHRRRRHVPRQVPQEPHPADDRLLGEVLLQAGQPRLPGVPDALRQDRRVHLLRPPLPRGRAALGLNGAEIVFNPSATVAGLSQYLWKLEQPAHAVANGYFVGAINRVGTEAPWNIGKFYGIVLLRRSARPASSRPVSEDKTSWSSPSWTSIDDRRGAPRVAVLPRSPPRFVRPDGGAAAMSLLIRNGTVVTASDTFRGDVLHRRASGSLPSAPSSPCHADRMIDATGKYVMPGGIDVHTHIDMPFGGTTSADDFETGHDRRRARRHDDDRRLRDPDRRARRCARRSTRGTRRPKARRRSTTAST